MKLIFRTMIQIILQQFLEVKIEFENIKIEIYI